MSHRTFDQFSSIGPAQINISLLAPTPEAEVVNLALIHCQSDEHVCVNHGIRIAVRQEWLVFFEAAYIQKTEIVAQLLLALHLFS